DRQCSRAARWESVGSRVSTAAGDGIQPAALKLRHLRSQTLELPSSTSSSFERTRGPSADCVLHFRLPSNAEMVCAPILDGLLDLFSRELFVQGALDQRRYLGIGCKAQRDELGHV